MAPRSAVSPGSRRTMQRRTDDSRWGIREAQRAAMCEGKQQHTRDKATLVAKKTKKKVKLYPYHCRFCGHWHIGSDQRRKTNEAS